MGKIPGPLDSSEDGPQSIDVVVESGDIGWVQADALVAPINSEGMWYGAIDRVIQRNAGGQFHQQALAQLPLSHGATVNAKGIIGQTNRGGFKNVVFVIDDLQGPLQDIIFNWLKAADDAGYTDVSVPTMRMGVMAWAVEKTPEATVEQMKLWIERFRQSGPKNLSKITFVVYNDPHIKAMMEHAISKEPSQDLPHIKAKMEHAIPMETSQGLPPLSEVIAWTWILLDGKTITRTGSINSWNGTYLWPEKVGIKYNTCGSFNYYNGTLLVVDVDGSVKARMHDDEVVKKLLEAGYKRNWMMIPDLCTDRETFNDPEVQTAFNATKTK